jgi:glycosyltransferase involved in cell wall biosynthesis
VIHSYSFYTNFGAWYAAAGTGAINIGSVRSDFANAIEDSGLGLGRFCARWPRAQIFNSVSAAENARKRGGAFVPREISVVRNALDLDRFAPSPLPRNELLKIIAIGSLVPVKRWDRLLKAACRLKQEGFIFVIRIAGDGPLRQSLLEKATELNIAHEVELIGQTENVPGLLSEATLLVHTSESEGCPNAVMEAMACARPVVATDVGDTRFLIEDGKTGFVVQNGDNGALAERIANLMNDRELCVRMGKAGRAKAEKEFGLERLVAETLGAYRAVGWRGT